jgi:hypothetical protein
MTSRNADSNSKRRASTLTLALTLACANALVRWLLWQHGITSHIYFRSDTRADGLLLGCALAAVYAGRRVQALILRYLGRGRLRLARGGVLLVIAFTFGPNDPFVFVGGLSAVALLGCDNRARRHRPPLVDSADARCVPARVGGFTLIRDVPLPPTYLTSSKVDWAISRRALSSPSRGWSPGARLSHVWD